MSEESRRLLEELKLLAKSFPDSERRIRVNKRTHRIRFEDETEDQVTIVVERIGEQPKEDTSK